MALHYYEDVLHQSLEIGFRLAGPDDHRSTTRLNQPSHNDWMFEAAFPSDDETVTDAVYAWITDHDSVHLRVLSPSEWITRKPSPKDYGGRLQMLSSAHGAVVPKH